MHEFTIYPAIDLRHGRCVRLLQGRADQETVYGDDPLTVARQWVQQGARFLHMVDLDGAFEGRPVQQELVCRVAQSVAVPVQVGGGLRTAEQIQTYLEGGVRRIIAGTSACRSPGKVREWVQAFGDAVAVGIDARGGRVQVSGWTETTGLQAVDLARSMADCGVDTLVVTDTARDGMLTGTDVGGLEEVCRAVHCGVIASGGVTAAEDIRALRALGCENLRGAIVGKALYEGRASLAALLREAGEGDS